MIPQKLSPGQTVGVYSPSGSIAYSESETALYERGLDALRRHGYRIKEGAHTRGRFYHMAGTAEEKASDIHALFADPEVAALLPSVGGHTASQILPFLDLDLIRRHPKPFVAFSDSAVLAAYIAEHTGIVTYHTAADVMFGFGRFGTDECPMQAQGAYTEEQMWNALEQHKPFSGPFSAWQALRQGEASGMLLGGNLKGIQALLGTPFAPNWSGKILYWEAADPPHVVAQVLAHLRNAGIFEQISGMVVGKVQHLKETFYAPDEIMPIHKFIDYIVDRPSLPIIVEADIGHDIENITVPNGCLARMSADDAGCSLEIQLA